MTTEAIIQSGITFGPYPAGQCFYIEKSACFASLKEGVKMAEFLLLKQQEKGPTVWVVEAKSSCPRDLRPYMDEIKDKLVNAFLLGVAACLGRQPVAKDELPTPFKKLNLTLADFRFVLVVRGVPEYHLAVLQEALAKLLRSVIKTWSLPPASVVVLNEVKAQKYGLIQPVAGVGE